MPAREFFFDLIQFHPHAFDYVDRVCIWQNPDAHEHSFLAGETHLGVVVFCAKNDIGDVTQPDERALVLAHDELLELISGVQIRVRGQVHLQERTLGIADSGKEIVSR